MLAQPFRFAAAVILAFYGPVSTAFAQPSSSRTIRGVVVDPSGASVPGATVMVIGSSGDEHRATSDPEGRFELAVPVATPFTVIGSARGFDTFATTVESLAEPITLALPAARVEEQVTVTATLRRDRAVSTATKTATPILQIPQSIEVVDAETLRSQAAMSMQDAMRNVAGVNVNLGEGRRDQFIIRGFNAQNDALVDGVRDDGLYYRDLATIDRIEVLKGPAAALFGRGSSGGVINRIVKAPLLEASVGEFAVTAGNLGARRVSADIGRHSASNRWAFRLVGAGEDSTSFRDSYFLRRGVVAPSLLWSSGRTSVLTQVEHLRDHRLPDRGIPSVNGAPADVRMGQSYGYPDDDSIDATVTSATTRFERRIGAAIQFRDVVKVARYDTTFSNTGPNGTRLMADGWHVQRQQYNSDQSQQNFFNQTELIFPAQLAATTHEIVAGMEIGSQTRSQERFNGSAGEVMLIDPVLTQPRYSAVVATRNVFDGEVAGVYVQDQVGFGRRWKALAGVRGDRFQQTLDDRTAANVDLARLDVNWSPRAGVVYQPTPRSSVYASVSRSFQPSGEGLSLAVNAAELKPESSRNVEAGAKAELFGGRASATAALFRLDRSNIKTTDPIDPTKLVLVGQQRTDGLELTFDGRLQDRLTARVGYAWLDAAVLRSNTVSSGVPIEGNRPGLVPRHSGNIWAGYHLTERWSFGGGAIATGRRFTSNDNLVSLPGFVRIDAAASYRLSAWEIALNARNVFNRHYYETAATNFQIAPGVPREVVLTFRVNP
jgi:catecholate siderophore receptor